MSNQMTKMHCLNCRNVIQLVDFLWELRSNFLEKNKIVGVLANVHLILLFAGLENIFRGRFCQHESAAPVSAFSLKVSDHLN